MRKKHKKLYIALFSFIGMMLVFFAIVAFNNFANKKKLLAEGIRTEVQVINKYKEVTRKGKTKRLLVDLAVFADTSQAVKNKTTSKKTPANINDKIDAMFEEIAASRITGDYQKITVSIASHNYRNIKPGDWKTFVYLKGKVEEGALLDELQ